MSTDAERIAELERELELAKSKLEGQEARPLTLAEIRAMSREQVEEAWERVKATVANAGESGDADPPSATERMRRGYAEAGDPGEVYRERRNKS